MNNAQPWLWPDKQIGKRESRQLREEHNRLVNSHAALVSALERMLIEYPNAVSDSVHTAQAQARAALKLAKGEQS